MRAKTMLGILIATLALIAAWKIGGVLMDACLQQATNNLAAIF